MGNDVPILFPASAIQVIDRQSERGLPACVASNVSNGNLVIGAEQFAAETWSQEAVRLDPSCLVPRCDTPTLQSVDVPDVFCGGLVGRFGGGDRRALADDRDKVGVSDRTGPRGEWH
jgi:hypothetical protein